MPVSTAVPSSLITSSPEAVRTASLFAVAVLASAAGAQSRGGVHGAAADPCPGARTQLALDECAARAATRADSAVGRAYRAVLARVDSTRRPALAEAQVAWERYRTAYCRYAASAYEGGSMQPMQYSFCMAGEAGLRARQLRRDAREEEGR